MITALYFALLLASAHSLVSDEWAMHALMSHSRRVRREIAEAPEDHPLRALATVTGATRGRSESLSP